MKCKFRKKCENYQDNGHTCNVEQFKENGEPYCGTFRKMEEKKHERRKEV